MHIGPGLCYQLSIMKYSYVNTPAYATDLTNTRKEVGVYWRCVRHCIYQWTIGRKITWAAFRVDLYRIDAKFSHFIHRSISNEAPTAISCPTTRDLHCPCWCVNCVLCDSFAAHRNNTIVCFLWWKHRRWCISRTRKRADYSSSGGGSAIES